MTYFIKIVFLLVCISINNSLNSQELSSDWFFRPNVGYNLHTTGDLVLNNVATPTAGLDQVWDFSFLPEAEFIDSVYFVSLAEATFKDSFPNSNLVKISQDFLGTWEWYYRVTEDTIYQEGIIVVDDFTDDTLVRRDNNFIITYDGFKFGDQISSNNAEFSYEFLATGKITTPFSTYENCILIKESAPSVGTGVTIYRWYHENLMREIFEFIPEESDQPFVAASWMEDYSEETISANTNTKQAFGLDKVFYKNDLLYINNISDNRDFQLLLFDLNGRNLGQLQISIVNGLNSINLPMESYNSTIQAVVLIDKQSQQFKSYKIHR